MNETSEPKVTRQQVAISAQRALELGTKIALVLAALGITGREQRALITADAAGTLAAQQWSSMIDSRGQPINKPVKFDSDVEILFRYVEGTPTSVETFPMPETNVELREPESSRQRGSILVAR